MYRQSDGRYVVWIPLKDTNVQLGNNFGNAHHRLLSLECKVRTNPDLKKKYSTFMQEYYLLSHMQLVNSLGQKSVCYSPHHCVFKGNDIRVVFDVSSKSETRVSPNDVLHVGPKIQDDLFDILIRFHAYYYILNANIEKMTRQILVSESDRQYQHLFC